MDTPPTTSSDMRIALTSSANDSAFVARLAADLQRRLAGIAHVMRVSAESDLGGASNWDAAQHLTQDCQIFAVVLSPSALASPLINAEIDLAWRLRGPDRAIVPIVYRASPVREDLETIQMSSFLPPTSYEQALDELVERFRAVHELLRRQSISPTAPSVEAPAPAAAVALAPALGVAPQPARPVPRLPILQILRPPALRLPRLSRAQRRMLLACGAAVLLLVTSIGLMQEVTYQQKVAQQREQAAQTATTGEQQTQTSSAAYTQFVTHATAAAATQVSAAITATAQTAIQMYTPYSSKRPTCEDSDWQDSGGTFSCLTDGVMMSGTAGPDNILAKLTFTPGHTLPFDYEMDITLTPLQGRFSMEIDNGFYIIIGDSAYSHFTFLSEPGDIIQELGTSVASSYAITYRYDGRRFTISINGVLLYAKDVAITFTSIPTLTITLNNEAVSSPYAAKVSNFSFIPIR